MPSLYGNAGNRYKGCKLVWPSLKYWDSYLDALYEGFVLSMENKKSLEEIQRIASSPMEHIESINQQNIEVVLPNGSKEIKQPFDIYWLVRQTLFIGAVGIIHTLNDYLARYGGHLGIGIRPSLRNQGYGEIATRLILGRAYQLGINPVYAFCDSRNIAMSRVFEKCGGILEGIVPNPYFEGTSVSRYKIFIDMVEIDEIIARNPIPSS